MAVDITVTTRSRGKITGKLQLDKDHSVVFATARAINENEKETRCYVVVVSVKLLLLLLLACQDTWC